MTTTHESRPWDFTHVLDLVNSLSFQQDPLAGQPSTNVEDKENHTSSGWDAEEPRSSDVERKDFASQTTALGDFSKIFQYLGTPVNSPAPAVQPVQRTEIAPQIFTTKTDYTSDGAAQSTPAPTLRRSVRWQDWSDTEGPGGDHVSDSSVIPESPTLTKSQRKKKNRRERKAKEAAEAANGHAKKTPASVSESEADFVARKAPAKKASLHAVNTAPRKVYNLRERDASGHAVTPSTAGSLWEAAEVAKETLESAKKSIAGNALTAQVDSKTPDSLWEAAKIAKDRLESAKKANANAFTTQAKENMARPSPASKPPNTPVRHYSHNSLPTSKTLSNGGSVAGTTQPPKSTPSGNVSDTAALQFRPATVTPNHQASLKPAAPPSSDPFGQNILPPKPLHPIQPLYVRSGEDRHWALLVKLIGDFYEDRKHLISPMNLTTHNNDPNGIHVFVDASNIFIGFKDQLKRARGIPPWVQVPEVDLSFDALALLMERRRPVAKRVLAGSTPWLPPFDKAKAVGYECSILEKVYKARELTERQVYFKEHDKYGVRKRAKAPPANAVATVNGGPVSGSGSGSETNAPQYAPARMIEQGVDEILHLKILESVVDAEKPSTIVLATGDAAQAEYSEGFMRMVERALKKGWTVELVSWSKNISAMYTRREWREAWGARFKIVTLDDYAEELLDM